MTVVLLWDIDGTLLSTSRGGVRALELAAREVSGADADLSKMHTAGLTDGQIAGRILEAQGVDAGAEAVQRFLRVYERELPAALGTRQGKVMPGVDAILDELDSDAGVRSLLLTGNTEAGAGAKLAHYGLTRYFDEGGAFCVDGAARATIAERAVEHSGPGFETDRALVIGDTVHDVECARAIGVRCLGVGTGGGTVAELEDAGAWKALEQLPEPSAFRTLIGL
ncbi:MAG: HAD hydrolase-like protein [Solirubrobacteraceae bacterium]